MYDSGFGFTRTTADGARIKHRDHWGGRRAASSTDSVEDLLNVSFIRCTVQLPCVPWLEAVMVCYADIRDEVFTMHRSNYVTLLRPFDCHSLLAKFNVD